MSASKLFIVTKQDTIVQMTGYLVRANDETEARDLVSAGMYIEETKTETMELLETFTASVEEVTLNGKGQDK